MRSRIATPHNSATCIYLSIWAPHTQTICIGSSAGLLPQLSSLVARNTGVGSMADEAKKALQVEVMAVKQKWGDEIK